MSPKGQNKGANGGKGGKSGKASDPEREKNWRCDECAYTNNCPWWTVCGRESCMGAKPDPKPQAAATKWDSWNNWSPSGWVDYSAPKPPDQLLLAARENLKAVAAIFPEGHAAVAEVAQQVHALEEAQKVTVPTSEKLRCLLYAQKELESKMTVTDKGVSDAAQVVKTASDALRKQMADRQAVQRELAANQLEVTALTRDVSAADSPPGDIVQSLRSRVDVLSDDDFEDGGFAKAKLGLFFRGFAKLTALIDHAERRAAGNAGVAPPPTPTPTPTIAPTPVATGAAVDPGFAAVRVEALATNTGLDSEEEDDSDRDGDETMKDGEASALAALEDANALLATSTSWVTTLTTAGGSSG